MACRALLLTRQHLFHLQQCAAMGKRRGSSGTQQQEQEPAGAAADAEAAPAPPQPQPKYHQHHQHHHHQHHHQQQHQQLVALHRSRCWEWRPSAVVAISPCPDGTMLLVGLESGDVELWDLTFMVCLQRICGFSCEVTALDWAKDTLDGAWRAFAAAMDGSIAEVACTEGRLVATTESGAGAVWALAAQPASAVRPGFAHSVMAGCDDGTVRVFGAEGGERGLQYERTLARLKGRVLALAWHPTGATLVAGGADGCIHALDPVTGVESMRITASASTRSPVCVWRLLVLPDGTLVSGDSSGAVQFWDGRFGTLLHRTTLHAADVLALAASGDGQRVWAAGVDTRVAMFERVAAAAPPPPATAGPTGMPAAAATKEGWAYTHYKRPHSHDVRALCVAAVGGGGGAAGKKKGKGGASSEVLISGGADAQLIAYPASRSFLNVHPARLTKAPQRPLCVLAAAAASATPAPRAAEPEQPARKKQKQQQQPAAAPPPQAAAGAEASAAPRLLLCAHDAALDVWQLGSAAATASASAPHPHPHQHQHPHRQPAHAWVEGQSLDLTSGPRHLVRIKLGDGARAGACSLSPDGNYVAAVTGSKGALRLYALVRSHSGGAGAQQQQQQPAPPDVRRVALQHLAGGERHVVATCFAGASLLVAADQAGTLSVLRLPPHNALLAAGQGGDDQPAAEPPQGPRAAALEAQCRLPSSATPSSTPGRLGKANAQGPQGWRGFLPPVSLLCASPDGSTVAAVGPSGVSLFRLTPPAATSGAPEAAPALLEAAMAAPLQLPQDAPVTAAAFSPDGKLLALAFASAEVQVVDVEAKRPTDWSVANAAGIATCVHQLPGSPAGLSFAPTAASGGGPMLLVFSPGGFCTFDLSRPVQAPESGGKRKRGRAKPADGPQQRAGAGPAVDHHQRAPSGGDAAAQQQQQQQHQKGGVNGRTVLLPDPVALVSFLGPSELLLLEKPWEDVVAALPPPLHKHRYGN